MSAENVSAYSFAQFDSLDAAARAPADVLATAWAEADAIRERARAEGEAAGYAAGVARGESELRAAADSIVRALGNAASELAEARAELTEALTRQAADISLAVSEQITAGAFEFQPELVVDVTRAAIRRLAERHRVTVLVSPDDLNRVAASLEHLRTDMGGIDFLEVQADRRVQTGGVIVETEYGEIDATIATKLHNAREIVAAGLVGDSRLQSNEQDDSGSRDAV